MDAPARGSHRHRMLVAYDGSPFRGFAPNDGVRTVGGDLVDALERVLRCKVDLAVAGRTDAGVHARGQVVSFDAPEGAVRSAEIRRSLNSMLGPSIVVREVAEASDDFHARFSARWRRYRYRLLTAEVPDPFLAATTWWLPEPLDHHRMADAAHALVGEHDFTSFCRLPKGRPDASMVRHVTDARWVHEPGEGRILTFEVTATAFCHQMVRSIVGTLVDIGRGRRPVSTVADALSGADRSLAGQLAPPHGLILWEVGY
ncbi:MAG: tRNA pseudouridine(38-40) synthase TruA [Microthrixaceae bacterium]